MFFKIEIVVVYGGWGDMDLKRHRTFWNDRNILYLDVM